MNKSNKIILYSIIIFITLLVTSIFAIYIYEYLKLEKSNSNNDSRNNNSKNKENLILNNKENLEIILINYKIDAEQTKEFGEISYEAVFNNPQEACPSIISSYTSRNHVFYIFIDSIKKLENNYEKYSNSIPYIKNNLYGLNKVSEMIKDQCKGSGYNIN